MTHYHHTFVKSTIPNDINIAPKVRLNQESVRHVCIRLLNIEDAKAYAARHTQEQAQQPRINGRNEITVLSVGVMNWGNNAVKKRIALGLLIPTINASRYNLCPLMLGFCELGSGMLDTVEIEFQDRIPK